ncbi:hypothetical protein LSH36_7g03044 [Paralvinella palmiformis]|uniref:Uncharacterized protein n=1 Tax=Paralvinella palmiformis TaxID=53620 RepID=A0AAD9KE80_9ANNE|nr:hypothetical protein LSH36_7g03044 [Paralvinella palmiformis]
MGVAFSRQTDTLSTGKRWSRCPQWSDVTDLFRSRSDLFPDDKYTVEYWQRVHVAWQVVHEESIDRWKRSQFSANYDSFPQCTGQNKPVKSDDRSNRFPCHDGRKDGSSIVYQIHSAPKRTFAYTATDGPLKDAEFQYIVPTSGEYVAFYLKATNLDGQRRGIVALYRPATAHTMYFFAERIIACEPIMAAISPDVSTVCLLLPSNTAADTGSVQYDVQVYCRRPAAFEKSFVGVAFELEHDIPGLQPDKGSPRIMFDPRHRCSRLGVINVNAVQNVRITHYFMVYDLQAKRVVVMPNEAYISNNTDLDLLEAGYSPDGAWVHALIGHAVPELAGDTYMRSVWIIHADSLQIVRTLDIGGASADVCGVNFLPIYSRSCRTMAVRHRKVVKVYQLPVPDSLRALCRSVIRQTVSDLETLNVSDQIKCYLQLKAYL